MKKNLLLVACFAVIVSASLAQKPAAPAKSNTSNASEDVIQYSLGVYMMQQLLAKTGFVVTNPTMFKKAIDDVIAKKPLMVDPTTTEARLIAYQKTFMEEKGKRLEKLLFDKVKAEKGMTALDGGVYYIITKAGKGPRPTVKDSVVLNVILTLPDGTEIDNTNKSKQSYLTLVRDMNPGLQDVLAHMEEGSVCRAFIPAAKAYGAVGALVGSLSIPPNSALIYDVALVSIRQAK